MISDHIKTAILALINIDSAATDAERERVRLALIGTRPNGRTIPVGEAAKILRVHRNTIRNWINAGRIEAVRDITGHVRGISEAAIAKI